jgi:Peptidase family M41/C-terminal, D2-small domain, of ClpB protein/AAA domain (Cdc48 subfamily)
MSEKIEKQINILEASQTKRKELLIEAVIQLKKEFIGIDNIIDELADSLLPWWLFPHHQIRPLIINLWGMTGSGKTALIQRLTSLLQYQNFLLRFDMGEYGNSSSFLKYTLTRQLSQFNEASPIIVLDEFQFAKTKDESGKEVNNYNLRIIWDLLDSGQLNYEPEGMNYYGGRAKRIMQTLKSLEKMGAEMKDGIVTKRIVETNDTFTSYTFGYQDSAIDRTANPTPFKPEEIFVSDIFATGIFEINNNNFTSYKEVVDEIRLMQSFSELKDFINIFYEKEIAFKTNDLSKSLIFVVGNLDEAYIMSNNINPDIDADEFRRYTQKITIADIKKALQSRFRNEQIARLGNTHLIYHAFSHQDFEDLIQMHLNKLISLVQEKFGIHITFKDPIKTLIYAEGVFPTQGVRPVVSTIRNMIESNIAKIILHKEEKAPKTDAIVWDFAEDNYDIEFLAKKKKISTLKIKALQKINSLRKSTQNDLQAIVAVHESGHAIAAMFLVNIVPEYVITKTVDTDSQGFTYTLLPEDIITYRLLLDHIRLLLGGYVAEAQIFGKECNTTGVGDDLQRATGYAHQILRDYGMDGTPARFNLHQYGGSPYQFTFSGNMEERALQIIKACLADVEACLKAHEPLLLEIAYHLSNNSRIDKSDMIAMSDQYFKKQKKKAHVFVTKDTYYAFRERLLLAHNKQ